MWENAVQIYYSVFYINLTVTATSFKVVTAGKAWSQACFSVHGSADVPQAKARASLLEPLSAFKQESVSKCRSGPVSSYFTPCTGRCESLWVTSFPSSADENKLSGADSAQRKGQRTQCVQCFPLLLLDPPQSSVSLKECMPLFNKPDMFGTPSNSYFLSQQRNTFNSDL